MAYQSEYIARGDISINNITNGFFFKKKEYGGFDS